MTFTFYNVYCTKMHGISVINHNTTDKNCGCLVHVNFLLKENYLTQNS